MKMLFYLADMAEQAVVVCWSAMAASISGVRLEFLGSLMNRVPEMMANMVASSTVFL